MLGNSPDYAAL